MASTEIILEAVSSVSQIPAADWDACANPRPGPGAHNGPDRSASPNTANNSCTDLTFGYNPFISHAFFSALEASGSACARTGWGPRHLLARLDGAIAGIVPCYLKSHRKASMSSTAAGPTHMNARVTTGNCRSRFHLPGDRPAPLDPPGRRPRAYPQRARERTRRPMRDDKSLFGSRDVCTRSRMEVWLLKDSAA